MRDWIWFKPVNALREKYGEDLILVIAPGGTLGYEGKVPNTSAGHLVETTVGRVVFYGIAPNEFAFGLVNRPLGRRNLGELIDKCYRVCGAEDGSFADAMMSLGYSMSTTSGISIYINMRFQVVKSKSL